MKVLYVTTIGGTMGFFKSTIKKLINRGDIVDIVTNDKNSKVPKYYNEWGCKVYSMDFSRNPLDKNNLKAMQKLKQHLKSCDYDIIHCHTPVAAMCTRIVCRKVRRQGTKIIYTAHGFHFYKGAPLKNWLIYYPVEKICSYWTDVLITINREDYLLAKKKMRARKIAFVPGVGINLNTFGEIVVNKEAKRQELGIPQNAAVLLSVGELNANKNHELVIRAISDMDVYYIIAGCGGLDNHLKLIINELGMENRVKLLGFRKDVIELCKSADLFVFPSFREGLSVALMEAMACGLPVVCSEIRGNTDLVDANGGGFFNPYDLQSCKNSIERVLDRDNSEMSKYNLKKITQYEVNSIDKSILRLYDCS